MILAGVSQKEIAELLGVTKVSVNDVVYFRRATPRIREAIAQAVALKTRRPLKTVYENLFPDTKPLIEEAAA